MARLGAIFNLLTVIFVLCGSFVNGRETTVEENKNAISRLFGELDKFVPNGKEVQTMFDGCCNKHNQLDRLKLYSCTTEFFTPCARALQANVQNFTGSDNEENKENLINALTNYEKALNDTDNDISTTADLALLILKYLAEIKEWKRTMNAGQIVFYDYTQQLSER